MTALPEAFCDRMRALLGEAYDIFLNSYQAEAVRALRVNTTKISVSDFADAADFSIAPIPYTSDGFYFTAEKIGSHPLHHAGAFYVQDPSAMIPALCAPIPQDAYVLDLCAAPGGKSSQLADALQTSGVLVSNEIMPARSKVLFQNLERQGFRNTIITSRRPDQLAEWFESVFDVVLVDAPCSGEGMFRKYPFAQDEWSEENVRLCAARQRDILPSALRCLKPNGTLIYSTCTFSPEENEEIVHWLIEEYGMALCTVPQQITDHTAAGIDLPQARRFYPHIAPGEGQFAVILRKPDDEFSPTFHYNDSSRPLSRAEYDAVRQTMGDAITFDELPLRMYQNRVIIPPHPDFPLPPKTVNCGVTVGELRKNRLIPHHQFFMAYGSAFRNQLELALDDPRLEQYLHGLEIADDTVANGWGVITVCGCPLGGFKASGGRLKNHYPKGLRNAK
ncbi:MAG: hypothetical protein ACI4PQ_06825 [Butyricicoccaceae bacterium]